MHYSQLHSFFHFHLHRHQQASQYRMTSLSVSKLRYPIVTSKIFDCTCIIYFSSGWFTAFYCHLYVFNSDLSFNICTNIVHYLISLIYDVSFIKKQYSQRPPGYTSWFSRPHFENHRASWRILYIHKSLLVRKKE